MMPARHLRASCPFAVHSPYVPGLVSILMPVFNSERYLHEAIESVQAQTYPHWELLIADDGSTDRSPMIVKEWAHRDPARIRPLTYSGGGHRGASAARNRALDDAQGEFIAMLDGDDIWLPEKLADQVAILRREPSADVVFGRTLYWHSWTGRPEDKNRDYEPWLGVPPGRIVAPPHFLARSIRGKAAVPCTCSIIMRHEAVAATGGFEEQFPREYDDQVFFSKLFLVARVLPIDRCWDKYRQHRESIVHSSIGTSRSHAARLAYLRWLEHYGLNEPPIDAGLVRAVRIEMWRCHHPLVDRWFDQAKRIRMTLRRIIGRVSRLWRR